MASELTFAEYFAGIGLVRLGLEPLGWRALYANDIDAKKHEMYSGYFVDDGPDVYDIEDIHKLDPERIPSTTLATASFPCIDLSIAGNQKGLKGKHSGAFWGLIAILQAMGDRRPPLILLENVLGWLNSNKGRDFPEAVAALNGVGYACDAFVLNAKHFVPQSRPRLFIVGAQYRPNSEDGPDRLHMRSPFLWTKRLRQMILQNSDLKWMTLDLPAPPLTAEHRFEGLVEELPDADERWWPQDKVDRLVSQMSPKHLQLVKHLVGRPSISYATVYKRVRKEGTRAEARYDGIAGCLRTPVGGSSKQIVIAAGAGALKVRWMTAREYARLQGVPDDYPIDVPYLQALWGFGDAVCVPAISWIAEHALNPLAEQVQGA